MSNLDTQTKQFSIVLNIPNNKVLNMQDLYDWFDRNTFLFAAIKHDKDCSNTGVLKTIHYHIVLKCASRYRISTMLYRIADTLKLFTSDELSCVHIQKCDSLPLAIQYLTHKNNPNKYQYSADDVITNINYDDFIDLYNSKSDTEVNTKYLVNLVKQGYTDFEIMALIGLGRYHLYKGAINDIRQAMSRTPNLVNQFLASFDDK